MARSLLLGAGLGLGTRLALHGPPELLWLHKVGVPWLAAAFLIGALRPGIRSGAAHGAVALALAVLVYYGVPGSQGGGAGAAWLWVAVPGGVLFGAAGAAWRTRPAWRLPTAVLVVAAFLGEALLWWARERPHAALALWCAAALALGLLLDRAGQRITAAVAAGILAVAAAVAELAVYLSLEYLVG